MTDSNAARRRDEPWLMRTYSGHSSAEASNTLYRTNLAKGQTGLSIAFDLPTQTGYDPDHVLARGEVGKVGVPVVHLGHMRTLIFPPLASRRIIVDMIIWSLTNAPKWNPMNVCSYHLQEVGATPVQEVAFSLANAVDVLDAVRATGKVPESAFTQVFASMSFFVNAGIRFIEEMCKLRAMAELWEEIGRTRYGITDERALRFRYGVQVNSLGLTEAQPENNVQRIVLEMLGVTLSKRARARSIQLPAWNEALGLPRPWDQQWSLRMQQVLAYETDLLEYGDIFDGSHVVERHTADLRDAARRELDEILSLGGAYAAVDELKRRLVVSMAERTRRIESGEQTVVGVNAYIESASSPLAGNDSILRVDPAVEHAHVVDVQQWRTARDSRAVADALVALRHAAQSDGNLMEASITLAKAGGTTGEWAGALREIFGEYRAPTGVGGARAPRSGGLAEVAERSAALAGGPPRLLVAKPGLDGHSSGAEQIAIAARDAGMEVVYGGIRLTPRQIAESARDEDPDVIGLSILSGSHLALVPEVLRELESLAVQTPVVVGGIIPDEDRDVLVSAGVAAVYTPKDYAITNIMNDIVHIVERHRASRNDH
ncbi:MAG: protein meaA [Actinobacteria bacterium]|nr:protein meaA [Actinomycetota bacterium]